MTSPLNIYTFYDNETKIWRGTRNTSIYNPKMGLGELVIEMLNKTPSKVTQISIENDAYITCKEQRLRSIRVAQNLIKLGYKRGDIIAVVARNGEKLAPILFGCLLIGCPVNTLDPSFDKHDLAQMFKSTRPKLIFCDCECLQEVEDACQITSLGSEIVLFEKAVPGHKFVDDFLQETGKEEYYVAPQFEDTEKEMAVIICSSGTTGPSKGVCLSHAQCVGMLTNIWQPYDNESVLCFSSLYWLSGLITLILGPIYGYTRVITRETFSPEVMVKIIEKYKISTTFTPPSQMNALCKYLVNHDANLSSIKLYLCGGSAVSDSLQAEMQNYIPKAKMIIGYGMSELAPCAFSTNFHRNGAVGYLSSRIEVKIADEEGNALDIGCEGEVYMRGEYQFMGYYNNDEANKDILSEDGWLKSGDIGRFDEDGFLYIVDRKKDIMKYKNFQISPTELEAIIRIIDGVDDVCVVGIQDIGTDLPAAVVIKTENSILTEADVVRIVDEQVSDYKRLRGGVYFVDELPMTPSGKIRRREVRNMATKLFNDKNNNV